MKELVKVSLAMFFLVSMVLMCCKEEEVAPDYIIIPVIEISNPEIGREIGAIRVHFYITVNGDSTVYTQDRDLEKADRLPCRKGIIGRVIEYEGNAHLTFYAQVLYKTRDTPGYSPWHYDYSYSNAFTLTFEVREGLTQGLVAPGKFITSTDDNPEPTLEWTVKNVFVETR